jgi:hypothetical protein
VGILLVISLFLKYPELREVVRGLVRVEFGE